MVGYAHNPLAAPVTRVAKDRLTGSGAEYLPKHCLTHSQLSKPGTKSHASRENNRDLERPYAKLPHPTHLP